MKAQEKKIRHEFKYILTETEAQIFELYIQKIGLKKDAPHGGSYSVTTLYFDTPLLEDYRDKMSGLKYRKKIRARVYGYDFGGESDDVWLEIKEKHDMNTGKKRDTITNAEWKRFSGDGLFFDVASVRKKDNKKLNNFFYLFSKKNYQPNVVVRYKRNAYVGQFVSDYRVTIDRRIEACKWHDFRYNTMVPVSQGKAVLEVKFFSAMPWWFRDMIYRFELRRQAFSKYTNAVDALNGFNPIKR